MKFSLTAFLLEVEDLLSRVALTEDGNAVN